MYNFIIRSYIRVNIRKVALDPSPIAMLKNIIIRLFILIQSIMIGSRYQIKPVLGGHDRFKTTQTSGG